MYIILLIMTHGGNIYNKKIEYDFSVNLNPLGMPDAIKRALIDNLDKFENYPDSRCSELCENLLSSLRDTDAFKSISENNIIFGNGAAELIYQIVQVIMPQKALLVQPSFSEYEKALVSVGCECSFYKLSETTAFTLDIDDYISMISDDIDIAILCNPNNPTGLLIPYESIVKIANFCSEHDVILLLDECFIELCQPTFQLHANIKDTTIDIPTKDKGLALSTGFFSIYNLPNVITLRAFTKTYAMAGLRLGYCIINNLSLIEKINQGRQPWSISVPAQIAGIAALKECRDCLKTAREIIVHQRIYLSEALRQLGFKVFPSDANYILFYSQNHSLYDELLARGILIRDCSNFRGLGPGYYRVCVGTETKNRILVQNIRAVKKQPL